MFYNLLMLVLGLNAAFELKCPDPAQWSLRAKLLCADNSKYYCLLDGNAEVYKENCTRVTFEPQGRKIVIMGNFDSFTCFNNRYQPFKYWTNVSSDCIFLRSKCTEEGQVTLNTGPDHDTNCRCDYNKGYDFITRQNNVCSCIPSQEDCTCYKRNCPNSNLKLSQDYTCLNETQKQGSTICNPINMSMNVIKNSIYMNISEVEENSIKGGTKSLYSSSNIKACVPVLVTIICLICKCLGMIYCGLELDIILDKYIYKVYFINKLPEEITGIEGGDVTITCTVSRATTEVKWTKYDKDSSFEEEISNSQDYSIEDNKEFHSLHIKNLELKHSARYTIDVNGAKSYSCINVQVQNTPNIRSEEQNIITPDDISARKDTKKQRSENPTVHKYNTQQNSTDKVFHNISASKNDKQPKPTTKVQRSNQMTRKEPRAVTSGISLAPCSFSIICCKGSNDVIQYDEVYTITKDTTQQHLHKLHMKDVRKKNKKKKSATTDVSTTNDKKEKTGTTADVSRITNDIRNQQLNAKDVYTTSDKQQQRSTTADISAIPNDMTQQQLDAKDTTKRLRESVQLPNNNCGTTGQNYKLVVAIEIGTCVSGYAYSSYDDFTKCKLKITHKLCWNSQKKCINEHLQKTPSCILLNNNRKLESFGYDAIKYFADLQKKGIHEQYFFVCNFNMDLDFEKKSVDALYLTDVQGKTIPAKDVFIESIRAIKIDVFRHTNKTERDIRWVLTVPAIWGEDGKSFMWHCIAESEIPTEQVFLALEHEAASIYCQLLEVERSSSGGFEMISPGTQYIVVDVGGGKTHISVHEKMQCGLKELDKTNGQGIGGSAVDNAVFKIFEKLFDASCLEKLRIEYPSTFINLCFDLENVKMSISPEMSGRVEIRLPYYTFDQLYKKYFDTTLENVVKSWTLPVELDETVLCIESSYLKKLFEPTINNIVQILMKIIKQNNVKLIFLVGGFSECTFLVDEIKRRFEDKHILVAENAGLAVLKGAVIYGHEPDIVNSRITTLGPPWPSL